jgi:hypothetical protein
MSIGPAPRFSHEYRESLRQDSMRLNGRNHGVRREAAIGLRVAFLRVR